MKVSATSWAARSKRRQLRRACEARIQALELPSPLQLSALKERLEQERGREIWVLPDKGQLPAEITGVWMGADTRDYVYFRQGLTGCRLEQTLLHEFAHMMLDHKTASVREQDWLRSRAPGLVTENVQHVCMRKNYASRDEQEAELLASMILARAEGRWRNASRSKQEEQAAARVESIFHT